MEAGMAGTRIQKTLHAKEIARILGATVVGPADCSVSGADVIERATATQLAFVGCKRNLKRASDSQAKLIVAPAAVRDQLERYPNRTFLLVDEAEPAYLQIVGLLLPERQRPSVGISPQAVVSASATIGSRTNIHALATIGEDVVIGENCDIAPGVVIGDGCTIGDDVMIHPNVVLHRDTIVGNRVSINAGTVIGGEGFGFRTVNGQHERLLHAGIVRICDDVQIGSCSTIDRAKVGETLIGTGTRIDSQVMIAHNCQIGDHNLLVSHTGIAGSSSTGSYVVCAGQSGIADHVHLGDGAIVGAKTGVHRDMPGGQKYLGIPARPATQHARETMALKRLPEMRITVKNLQKQLATLQEQMNQLLTAADSPAGSQDKAA
ncbi:MAG TPA: UDP-3-O-(3-hydroxymyristoyl)glucosamine N-acyltransferase [Planctomycetes bacterium]|nr:UDP-3-O-(3-hydroxymyristoyl)glucosamine N-acyltransferase [Fuerstiella sp.]HIK90713.1 UDP-3-O-(3-hydroxymyristoyl)glucosamine N-acyltransferase [Planctomycetota bacterium]